MPVARTKRTPPALCAGALALLVTACGPAALPPGDTVADREEASNREAHEFNRALDRAVVRPVANAYGTVVPPPIRRGVSNFAGNLDQPGHVVNNLLQLRLGDAARNTARFAINSTIGVGGLFDPATAIGLTAAKTDFGETLHLYGVGEGPYLEVPVLGPSTGRDLAGSVVDLALNPVRMVTEPPASRYAFAANVSQPLEARHALGGTIDGILYESADSYLQLRSFYLQMRRFDLGGAAPGPSGGPEDASAPDAADPFAEIYLDPYAP